MRSDSIHRDGKTAFLYRERRYQHRYQRRVQKPDVLSKDFEWRDCSPFELPDQMKTMDYQEFDELMFSDSRIKNYNHQSTDTYHKNRAPLYSRQRCSKMTSACKSAQATFRHNQEQANKTTFDENLFCQGDLKPSLDQQSTNYFHVAEFKPKKAIQKEQSNKRRTSSALNKRSLKKQSFSIDDTKNKESALSPTIFSMKLSKPSHIDRLVFGSTAKEASPKNPIKKERITIYSKEKKIEQQKKDNRQKMKFAINGWQYQNPSFHQLQDIYAYNSPQKEQMKPREVKTAGERRRLYQMGKIC